MLHRYQEITDWGHRKQIYTESDIIHQISKFDEEFVELKLAWATGDREDLKDAIGDCVVCLVHVWNFQMKGPVPKYIHECEESVEFCITEVSTRLASAYIQWKEDRFSLSFSPQGVLLVLDKLNRIAVSLGLTLEECIEKAWKEIEHRPGKMVKGKFVKEAV